MASNSITGLVATRIINALPFLHDNIIAPFYVNQDIEQDPQKPGAPCTMPFYGSATVGTRSASNVFTAPGATTVTNQSFSYDYHKYVDFGLEDTEAVKINISKHKQSEIESKMAALASQINSDVWAACEGVLYQAYGTPGTAPFGSGVGILSAARAAKLLDDEDAPPGNRTGVINGAALENARQLSNFVEAQKAASAQTLRKGVIGEVYNINWVSDNAVYYHTKGTLSDGTAQRCSLDGIHAIGATTISAADTSLTGTLTKGDIFTKAGDDQTYTVTALATAASNAIEFTINPGFRLAGADDALCTFKGSYRANLVFERDAIGLKSAPLSWEMGSDPNIVNIYDPLTQWTFRLERQRQEGQTRWIIDCLYAVKCFDGRRGAILFG